MNLFSKKNEPALNQAIENLTQELLRMDSDDSKYSDKIALLERLTKIRDSKAKWRVSPDTVLIVLGNLLGIVIIVAFEHKGNLFRSEGTKFIIRPKGPGQS